MKPFFFFESVKIFTKRMLKGDIKNEKGKY